LNSRLRRSGLAEPARAEVSDPHDRGQRQRRGHRHGCGNGVEAASAPPNCAIDARMEMLDGRGVSSVVDVDRANGIENRLIKALQYEGGRRAWFHRLGARAARRRRLKCRDRTKPATA
jgi:hypothetical protein